MNPKLFTLILFLLIQVVISGCASGGGSKGIDENVDNVPPPPSTPTDERIAFDEFSYTYTPNIEGYSENIVVTYQMAPFTTSGLPDPTEKYTISDYGFFEITVIGNHNGCPVSDCGDESVASRHFTTHSYFWEADLNGDGHMDFY